MLREYLNVLFIVVFSYCELRSLVGASLRIYSGKLFIAIKRYVTMFRMFYSEQIPDTNSAHFDW